MCGTKLTKQENEIKLIALAIITLLAQSICAQNIFKAIVKDGDTKEILVGVNAVLNKTANGASSDENGIITIRTYLTESNISHSAT